MRPGVDQMSINRFSDWALLFAFAGVSLNPTSAFSRGAPFDLLTGTDRFNASVFRSQRGTNPAPAEAGSDSNVLWLA
jgi:hypothetical protein